MSLNDQLSKNVVMISQTKTHSSVFFLRLLYLKYDLKDQHINRCIGIGIHSKIVTLSPGPQNRPGDQSDPVSVSRASAKTQKQWSIVRRGRRKLILASHSVALLGKVKLGQFIHGRFSIRL